MRFALSWQKSSLSVYIISHSACGHFSMLPRARACCTCTLLARGGPKFVHRIILWRKYRAKTLRHQITWCSITMRLLTICVLIGTTLSTPADDDDQTCNGKTTKNFHGSMLINLNNCGSKTTDVPQTRGRKSSASFCEASDDSEAQHSGRPTLRPELCPGWTTAYLHIQIHARILLYDGTVSFQHSYTYSWNIQHKPVINVDIFCYTAKCCS